MSKFTVKSKKAAEDVAEDDYSSKKTSKNGSKRSFKKDSFKDKVASRSKSTMNDISWYAKNEQLLRDAASIPYQWMTGLRVLPSIPYNEKQRDYVVPGILAAGIYLDPMTLNDPSDPVNVVARKLVGFIRSYNSGAKNYDPNDLMIRLIAEGEFLAQLNWVIRIFATVNMYSAYNKYMPSDLLEVQGVDFDNIRTNLANFRAALNHLIAKAASVLYIPKGLPIYDRWTWLFNNYFCDSSNPKDQLYLLFPIGYHHFGIDENTSMGALLYKSWVSDGLLKWTDLISGLDEMLAPLFEDQEMCIMVGDMWKAYGASALTLSVVPDNLFVSPIDDPIVLHQFKNSRTICPNNDFTNDSNLDIIQSDDGTYLLNRSGLKETEWAWTITSDQDTNFDESDDSLGAMLVRLYQSDHFMDTVNTNPTAVDNMENSRLACMVGSDIREVGDRSRYRLTSGSEKIAYYVMVQRVYNAESNLYIHYEHKFMTANFVPAFDFINNHTYTKSVSGNPCGMWCTFENFQYWAQFLRNIAAFDYAPNMYYSMLQMVYDGDDSYYVVMEDFAAPYMSINNFALVPCNMMEKMNNCALLSEFDVTGFQPSGKSGKVR